MVHKEVYQQRYGKKTRHRTSEYAQEESHVGIAVEFAHASCHKQAERLFVYPLQGKYEFFVKTGDESHCAAGNAGHFVGRTHENTFEPQYGIVDRAAFFSRRMYFPVSAHVSLRDASPACG